MTTVTATLRIGTRGSALALAQARLVVEALEARGSPAELVTLLTEGDRRLPDTPWGEGAFVGAIEAALLGGEIDVAVHSAKDVPTDEDPRLSIAAYLPRADAADVLVLAGGARRPSSLGDLPAGTRVGTDSPRRTAFLRAAHGGLVVHSLHGNVDTRLRRLDRGETDALVLAAAGLERLGRSDRISMRLDPGIVPPAPGQGALAIQVRAGSPAEALVRRLDDPATRACVSAERSLLALAGGGCRTPLGALASLKDGTLRLVVGYARGDGAFATIVERTAPGSAPAVAAGLVVETLAELAANTALAAVRAGAPRVIVTRAIDQAPAAALALVDRGLAPLVVPAIERHPGPAGPLAEAVAGLATIDWVVVTSAAAVGPIRSALDRLPGSGPGPRWAAVGGATTAALRAAGIEVAFRPSEATGTALAEEIPVAPGDRVLLARSDLGDERLPHRLRERGTEVVPLVAYETVEGPAGSVPLLQAAIDGRPAAVVFTSGSTVRGLVTLAERLGPGTLDALHGLPALVIGGPTAREAERLGFTVAARAAQSTPAALAEVAAAFLDVHLETQ